MRLVLLREIPEDENLQQEWNSLVMRSAQPQVFYTYEWSLAVYRAYGEKLRPLLFLAYEGETLAGIAALASDEVAGDVSFLCATTGDYCDFLSASESNVAFVSAVLEELRKEGFGQITLTNLPADSVTVSSLRNASGKNGYHLFARTAYQCAQVSLTPFQIRETDTKPALPGAKKLRRCLHTLGRETMVRFDHVCSWAEVQPILPQFIQTHVARFVLTGRISNLARPERCVFLEALARLLSEGGWLVLTRMIAGERAIAWNYGFQFAGTWFWYQPTFDSEFEKYSPGTCLLARIVEEATQIPEMKVADLGLGAEDYKETFANQTRRTLYITLRASVSQHAREMLRYTAASAIKTSPKLEAGVRALVARCQTLKETVREKGLVHAGRRFANRLIDLLWSTTEVVFFESYGEVSHSSTGRRLERLDLNRLASAVSQYANDQQTCTYLLRCAARLREQSAEGFALVDEEENLLHFAWCTAFRDFFLSELNAKVDAPSEECAMIFDCWTPESVRGHGYYAEAVSLMARLLHERGGRPWIFSAVGNVSSMRGLEKTGFQRRYSLIRERRLGWQHIRAKAEGLSQFQSTTISAQRGSHVA